MRYSKFQAWGLVPSVNDQSDSEEVPPLQVVADEKPLKDILRTQVL